jgi:hypothetical protein
MSENSLVTVNLNQLPSTQIGTDEQFADLAKGGDFIGRMQLFTKGKAINKELIRPGHYGIPESDEEVIDLGTSVDILPLARRPKAIDMTDLEALVISYDPESAEFNRISVKSNEPDSHCQFGPSFLVYERATGRFLEFFCGTKTNRIEAKKIYPFLPVTDGDLQRLAAAGKDVSDLVAHGPIPLTLKVKLAENRRGSWHAPVVVKCSTPFTKLPPVESFVKEITKFLTIKDNGVEKVAETSSRAR